MSTTEGRATPPEARKLAAIMFTDIVGFSRQMGSDEARMLRLLDVHNQIIRQAVTEHHGHVIKTIGDAFLVDFPSVVHAVQCAQQIQAQLRVYNAEKDKAEQIHVRIGIHLGDVVQRDGDVFGDGVNIASRLQSLAEPDTICLSQKVYEEVAKKIDLSTVVALGKPKLKNIAERFHIYALLPETPKGLRQQLQVQRLKLKPFSASLAPAGLLLVGGLLALLLFRMPHSTVRNPEALPLPDKPSIVVLPFINMSEDPQQDSFSDGITEDLTADLAKISSLFVISRYSAFTYKGKTVKVQDVSRELGVRYVLEGSVRKSDNQVRITTQLIDATTGGHVWSERYDRPLQNIFALQDEIRHKIIVHLALKLTDVEQERLERMYTRNPEAFEYRLRGMAYLFRFTREDNAQARQMSEKAIALDPTYAEAYALQGFTHWMEWGMQWSQDPQTLERAFALAQQALALDDSLSLSHELVGWVLLAKKQPEQAIPEFERVIAYVNWSSPYAGLAASLNAAGRPAEAIAAIEKALRLIPRNPFFLSSYLTALGGSYRLLGRYEEAITVLKRALTLNAKNPGAHQTLAVAYSELGREAEARAEVGEILKVSPQFSLEGVRQRLPYKDPAETERFLAALRKAGLK